MRGLRLNYSLCKPRTNESLIGFYRSSFLLSNIFFIYDFNNHVTDSLFEILITKFCDIETNILAKVACKGVRDQPKKSNSYHLIDKWVVFVLSYHTGGE